MTIGVLDDHLRAITDPLIKDSIFTLSYEKQQVTPPPDQGYLTFNGEFITFDGKNITFEGNE